MAKKLQKTNAMRILDAKKIAYAVLEYPHGDTALPGEEVARLVYERWLTPDAPVLD